jgi:hypothetical protein
LLFRALVLLGAASSIAWAQGDLPDCYRNPELAPHKPVPNVTAVVLLDDTTIFDEVQRAAIKKEVTGLAAPGVELHVLRFSANIQGRYTTPVLGVYFSSPLEAARRNHIKKPTAAAFDHCRDIQQIRGRKKLQEILDNYWTGASNNIARSEILAAIHDTALGLVANTKSKRVVLLMVSDMLEHSAATSFYAKGGIRHIDPRQELEKAEKAGVVASLRGAAVYVLGAGVAPRNGGGTEYVDTARIGALKSFWNLYFERSGGRLSEFGQPLLLQPISLSEVR